LHLHGEIFKNRSVYNTEKTYPAYGDIKVGDKAPDGGQLRPFIVWFEEQVPMLENAIEIVANADIFVVIGTSLQVYPAASLLNYTSLNCPTFIIDKNIPKTTGINNLTIIEATAAEGIETLITMLLKDG
jgi:NAD-dependent deacetylase